MSATDWIAPLCAELERGGASIGLPPAAGLAPARLVTIDADQEVRIVMRIQRGGVTLQTRRVRSFGPETGVVRFPIRNGIAAGRARLLVTMTNEDGVSKSQTRRLRIPAVS